MICGEIGLKVDEYYSLNYRQYNNIVTGYAENKIQNYRNNWERTREIAFWAAIPSIDPKVARKLTSQQFMPFDWEDAPKDRKPKFTHEQIKEHFDKIDK